MAAPHAVAAPSRVQKLMSSSSRRFDGKSRSLDDREYLLNKQSKYDANRYKILNKKKKKRQIPTKFMTFKESSLFILFQ